MIQKHEGKLTKWLTEWVNWFLNFVHGMQFIKLSKLYGVIYFVFQSNQSWVNFLWIPMTLQNNLLLSHYLPKWHLRSELYLLMIAMINDPWLVYNGVRKPSNFSYIDSSYFSFKHSSRSLPDKWLKTNCMTALSKVNQLIKLKLIRRFQPVCWVETKKQFILRQECNLHFKWMPGLHVRTTPSVRHA